MPVVSRAALWTLVGAVPVVAAAGMSVRFGPPVALEPLAVIVPMFLLSCSVGDGKALTMLVVPWIAGCGYLLASIPVLRRATWANRSAAALFLVVVMANAAYFATNWSLGVAHLGSRYMHFALALNLVCGIFVGAALFLARRDGTTPNLVIFHSLLFFWLNWTAFPWLGPVE